MNVGCGLMRPEEVEKYTACYRKESYRMGKRNRQRALKDIQSIPKGSTYLDVGCGRGETLIMAREHGLVAWGVEIVPQLWDAITVFRSDITHLSFDDIDYVSCYDVLEHLPPEDVGAALDELFRVANKALFITTNDRKSQFEGFELHLTRQPCEWWEQEFSKRGYRKIEQCTFATERDCHWRIDL